MRRLTDKAALLALALALGALGTWTDASPADSQVGTPLTRAEAYLRGNAQALGLSPDLRDLRLTDIRSGLSGDHVRYQQTLDGIPLFGRFLTVSLPASAASAEPPFVVSRALSQVKRAPVRPVLPAKAALAAVETEVSLAAANLRGDVATSLVYFPTSGESEEYVLSWQVIAPTLEPLGSWLFVVRADSGEVLLRQNLLRLDSGRVFDPNPGKSSGGAIPPPNDCDSGANESALAPQYAGQTLRGINAGQNRLIGEFADLSAPGIVGAYKPAAVADEPSRNYVYACDDDRFEEVMAYYHLDTTQRKIQSLGFSGASGILDRPISVHAHFMSTCNAFFDPVNLGVHFGDGDGALCGTTADSAEDADVIAHEYGHAIQHDQVPGWGFGLLVDVQEALAMGEGFGDFLTAAIFGDPCLGEWFNIGETACSGSPGLRSMVNTAAYNGTSVVSLPSWCSAASDPHCAGLVWGGALWDLVLALGGDAAARDTVLTLTLDSQFYLNPQSTFTEAAAAVRQSDTLLYGGAHVTTIDSVFSARGISSLGAISDFPYAYLRILHPRRGDLDVQLQVGADPANPVCTVDVWNPNKADTADDLVGFLDLGGDPCETFLSPTPATPWWLEVRDVRDLQTGSIEQFEIVLSGTGRCLATDLPIAIPDSDGFVYSRLDCTTAVSPPGDNDGDTIPDPIDTDDDNDGFSDTAELLTGTDHLVACASTTTPNDEADDRWPPDFNDDKVVNITDVVQVLPPFFGSTSADPAYSARRDLAPDSIINITDVGRVLPPTFGTGCS